MSLKAKIDVFPFDGYLLQDPSVVSVMQAVVRGNKTGGTGVGNSGGASGNETGSGGVGGGNANKRREAGGGTTNSERRIKTPLEKLMSLRARCREQQRVQSVEGVLLVHAHDHPHVLLLRHNVKTTNRSRVLPATNTNSTAVYRLPGGRCRNGEPEELCLLRKLGRDLLNESKRLTSSSTAEEERSEVVVDVGSAHPNGTAVTASSSSFRVGEVLARWYRPHFDPLMYPYVPAHVAENDVREVRTIFLVHMPPRMLLTGTYGDEELVAAPLFDLYDNTAKYGVLIASIPTLLSRVNINYCR
ncbi:nucleotide hydrolase, putative [Trypanosoma equiperdum]|uniref:Cleavage and polyadenylation specificity factor subunit 5 n=3 Tax=Trypanozoon TaxID=39700 RepID=Q57WN8_TRYB2|nr:hypothetical protein, conserved [Trypanosoma brucei gambiense DAL972]XP_845786.1 hypothetical protein, conserved [Trypanosoma brucei brucei TREU927]AAX69954.1 hypothetical protein, conserved [Trypanosoma brucei]SCU71960.1 nucleotide hydrolase, putative [Trypanosoma equiperdum]AAZ12227.1 hypothetical protein, conserved [Trypanosoma brucei brucei TREU927]CBH12190.1 hypothetical protein, conserved [Trypanosoma brucei gambiense DAL972]|eukprot:XP_011774473.1 hypothetical protein, conserved [Trypanosoma brucei gambiense DAL972]